MKIQLKSKFPYKIEIESEQLFLPKNDINSVADWCSLLIGKMEKSWNLEWDSVSLCWVWGFRQKIDASLFQFTWVKTF